MSVLLDLILLINYLNETALFKNVHLNWILPILPILRQNMWNMSTLSAILEMQASCLNAFIFEFRVGYADNTLHENEYGKFTYLVWRVPRSRHDGQATSQVW